MKNKAIYLTAIGIVALIFINLDSIVGHLVKNDVNHLKKVNFEDYNHLKKNQVYFTIDPITVSNDDFETISVSGLACADTTIDNSDKEVTLLFKSNDVCYASKKYSGFGSPPPQSKTQFGYNHDFSRTISTLPMRNGEYDMYIYCYENDQNYGIVNTGQSFIKDNSGFQLKDKIVNLKTEEADVLKTEAVSMSYIKPEQNKYNVSGWIFNEDTETENQQVYLEITVDDKKTYVECVQSIRRDVSSAFKNNKYDYSGYNCSFDKNIISDNVAEIRVIMKNEEKYYVGTKTFKYNPLNGEITENAMPKSNKIVNLLDFNELNLNVASRSWLDYVETKDNQLVVEGWIFNENTEAKEQQVYLEITQRDKKTYIECSRTVRTDVSAVYKNNKYDYSGYRCDFDKDIIDNDIVKIRIVMKDKDKYYTSDTSYEYNLKDKVLK